MANPKIDSILILDDDPISLLLTSDVLEQMGIVREVIPIEDGTDALKLLESITPQLIFVDILMPVMDGFTFIQELYKIKKPDGQYKIIALTAHLTFIERLRFEALGVEDFLTKPLTKEKIAVLIDKYY